MNALSSIDKLNSENYATWSIQIKSLLITLDLWSVIQDQVPTAADKKAVWDVIDQKALATINLSVRPSELIHIKNCNNAKTAWNTLENLYRANTACRKVNLFKNLVRFKIRPAEKITTQVGEFCGIIDDLKSIGIELNEDFVSVLLLCSLPEEMENFVVAVESQDKLPKIEQLISKVLEEERRQGDKGNVEERVFAINTKNEKFTKYSNNKYHRKNNNRYENKDHHKNSSNIKCFKCGHKGHIRSQCKANIGESVAAAFCAVEKQVSSDLWVLDSGATSHMCRNKEMFDSMQKHNQQLLMPSGECVSAVGKGVVKVKSKFMNITLLNVLYVPKFHSNFLSISKFLDAGHSVSFENKSGIVKNKNKQNILSAYKENGIFYTKLENRKTIERINSVSDENEFKKWHSRFGHLNKKDLNKLANNNMVNGLNIKTIEQFDCMTCAEGKISAKPFHSYSQINTKETLELVHTDLCGPFKVKSQGGAFYFITFIDDYSRYITTYFLKKKSEAFEAFKTFTAMAEKQTGRKIKSLRSDNGKEYVNSQFKSYFQLNGILHQTTVSHTPQQNGVAERVNRTLVEMVRCMLCESGLTQSLWAEAINTATYIRNRSPTKVLGNVTPYERWCNKKPSVSHFRKFGCDAVVLQKNRSGGKLTPKGKPFKLVGYENLTKGYRLYDTNKREVIKARDVIFFENSFKKSEKEEDVQDLLYIDILNLAGNDKIENKQEDKPENKQEEEEDKPENKQDEEDKPENEDNQKEVPQSPDKYETASSASEGEPIENDRDEDKGEAKTKRTRGRPKILRTGDKGRPKKVFTTTSEMLNSIIENPQTVAEALNSHDAVHWKKAMDVEYKSLMKNKTWMLVDRPDGCNVIGSKWVFAVKRKPDGSVEKYKARLVAQGCSQKYNIDYQETFAPVVRHSTIRILLAIAVKYKLLVNHIDIVAAYLNGDLEDDVFMEQPPMFEDAKNAGQVCKLTKALYGLKQSGREWNKKVTEILQQIGFNRCKSDSCVYFRRQNNKLSFIALYVDDMMLASSSKHEMDAIIGDLNKYVEADDRGPISFYLGMEIEREGSRGAIHIHQETYTKDLLKRFNMDNSKPASTPWANGTVLQKCENQCKNLDDKTYQSLIGSLMYLTVISRPDISHVVSKLSQFNSHPHEEHLNAAKYLLRYLNKYPKGMISYCNLNEKFICFTDADWGCDSCDRKSYTGFVMFMAGGAVAWESKKQSVVALSTMEAEYVAVCQGAKEVVFVRNLLEEMGFNEFTCEPTRIMCDNQGAQFMVKNPTVHKRSKHIDIRFHYIREQYTEGNIEVEYVSSENNAADVLTKTLSKEKHVQACSLLNIKM